MDSNIKYTMTCIQCCKSTVSVTKGNYSRATSIEVLVREVKKDGWKLYPAGGLCPNCQKPKKTYLQELQET